MPLAPFLAEGQPPPSVADAVADFEAWLDEEPGGGRPLTDDDELHQLIIYGGR